MCSRTRSVSGTRPTCNIAPVRIRFSGFVGSPPKTRTFPRIRLQQSQQQLHRGRFPRPVRPEQRHNFSGAHPEIDATQRPDASIILVHAFETGDDTIGSRPSPVRWSVPWLRPFSFLPACDGAAANSCIHAPAHDCIIVERHDARTSAIHHAGSVTNVILAISGIQYSWS